MMIRSAPRPLALAVAIAAFTLAAAPRLARAADGTVVVEVAGADGKLLPGDVKVLKVGTETAVKSFAALTGEGQGAVAAGDYELKVTTRSGGLTGTSRVTVVAGKTQRFRVVVAPAATARTAGAMPMMRGAPNKMAAMTPSPTAGVVLRGQIKTATGAPATGTVRIILEVPLSGGSYAVKGLPAGSYRVEHTPAGKPVVTKSVTLGKTDQVVDLIAK